MKKIYFFLFTVCTLFGFSQAPKYINYQGIARSANGQPITTSVKIKFEIYSAQVGGTLAHSEVQTTNTNSLGLFSTQIGAASPLNLDWGTGSWYLDVSIDSTNTGNSFVNIGRQHLVSVPYSLYADSAGKAPSPAVTFSNNILNVGTNSVSIPSSPVYTAGNEISITSGTITNTAPDQTVTITPFGNAQIMSSYPNFSINVIPQQLSISNNVISLSNGGGTIVLPSTSLTPNTSLTSSGIVTVTSSGTNTFNVGVLSPTITGNGGTTVSGVYPNFVVSSPTVAPAVTTSISGAGIATVTPLSGNNFTVNVSQPTITGNGGTTVSGVYPNFTVSSSPIVAAITPTVTGTGLANVTPTSGNNFTVNVPPPSLTYNANVLTLTQGAASSAVTIPAAITPTISGAGIATVTPLSGNNFTVNVAPLNLTGIGSATVSGTYPNITVNTPVFSAPPPGWTLFGNAGTNPSNFIGTTDNVALNFRVNNQKSGRIDQTLSNTFFGYWSGRDNTTGSQNTAFGINSLIQNTSGGANTAFGSTALAANILGINNTALGTNAGGSAIGSGNVFLGNQAGASETGSNKLYIANNNSGTPLVYGDFSTGRIGLGTTTPSTRLEINNGSAGAIKIVDGTQAFGKVLTSDAAGLATWQLPNPNPGTGSSNYIPKWNGTGNALTPSSLLFEDGFSLGIGTTAPTTRLHINGSNSTTFMNAFSASPETAIRLHNNDQTNGNFSSLIFSTQASNAASFEAAKILGVNTNHLSGSIAGDLVFMTRNSSNINEVARITSTGNFGIGTTNPLNKLHVNGGVTITDGTQGAGKVLTSDAGGNATWAPGQPKIAFNAGSNAVSNQSVPAGIVTTVIFGPGNNFFNDGGGYNTVTNQFTPPSPGIYNISTYISIQGTVGASLQVWINGPGPWLARSVGSIPGSAGTTIVHLTATVNTAITPGPWTVQVYSTSALTIIPYDSGFSGFKVY